MGCLGMALAGTQQGLELSLVKCFKSFGVFQLASKTISEQFVLVLNHTR